MVGEVTSGCLPDLCKVVKSPPAERASLIQKWLTFFPRAEVIDSAGRHFHVFGFGFRLQVRAGWGQIRGPAVDLTEPELPVSVDGKERKLPFSATSSLEVRPTTLRVTLRTGKVIDTVLEPPYHSALQAYFVGFLGRDPPSTDPQQWKVFAISLAATRTVHFSAPKVP